MEMERKLPEAIAMRPEDLRMLERTLESVLPPGSTAAEREFRAATLVNLFRSGLRSEIALVRAVNGDAPDED